MKTALIAALILTGFSAGILEATDQAPCYECIAAAVTR